LLGSSLEIAHGNTPYISQMIGEAGSGEEPVIALAVVFRPASC